MFVVLLVALAVASAQFLVGPGYAASGAYGAHNAFAVSSQARVDAPRNNLVAIGGVPLGVAIY